MRYFLHCSILLLVLVLTSCRKAIPRGTKLHADGSVFDIVKRKSLAGVTVYMYGGVPTGYPEKIIYDLGPVDSAITDTSGNFSMDHKAEGRSVDYALTIEPPPYYQGIIFIPGTRNYVAEPTFSVWYPFNRSSELANVQINGRELNFARINLHVISNPYDTLQFDLSQHNIGFLMRNQVLGNKIDITFLDRYLPGSPIIAGYDVNTVTLSDSLNAVKLYSRYRRIADTIPSSMADTIYISKTINSTYDLPIVPY